jgi:hypothetical protein
MSSALHVGFPVVLFDKLCVALSHQVLDVEITIWRRWSLHCAVKSASIYRIVISTSST